jgi:predicted lipase
MTIMHYLPFPSTFGILFITFIAITFVLKVSNRSLVRNKIRTRELQTPTFANTFPDRHLVANLMQLSEDIYDVDDGVPPQDAISNPYYEFKFWIEALLSTEAMIVLDNEKSPSLTTTTGRPIIVFRGSEERDDWEVNFNIPTEKSEFINAPDSVKIHRGFQSALFDQNIISQLETELLQLIGKDGDVIVTGHSLG